MIREQIYNPSYPLIGERNDIANAKARDESSCRSAQKLSSNISVDLDPVFTAIRRIIHSVDSRSKQVARATGLTIPQIVVLKAVRDLGEVPTNRISAYADLTAATDHYP